MRPRGIVTLTEGLWEAREGTAAVRPYLEIMEATVTTEWQAVEAGDEATQSTIKCELLLKIFFYTVYLKAVSGDICVIHDNSVIAVISLPFRIVVK